MRDLVPRWRADGAEGAKISWPVADVSITDELASAGIKPDAYVAYRSASRLSATSDLEGVLLRSAYPSDLDSAVALNRMVLDEHVAVVRSLGRCQVSRSALQRRRSTERWR